MPLIFADWRDEAGTCSCFRIAMTREWLRYLSRLPVLHSLGGACVPINNPAVRSVTLNLANFSEVAK